MERKSFLKSLLLGAVTVPVALSACEKEADAITPSTEETVTDPGTSSDHCTIAPTETQGPFPNKSLASYVRCDITDGRTGYKMMDRITSAAWVVLPEEKILLIRCDTVIQHFLLLLSRELLKWKAASYMQEMPSPCGMLRM